jgi:coenzyme F420-reducing hydrogenase beta subunit
MAENQKRKGQQNAEGLGIYKELFSAKSNIDGQDGGVVSAMLVSGLEKGLFDVAVVVQRSRRYQAEAVATEEVEEVLAAKGTKYLRVNTALKLREAVNQGKKRVAVVCTPCQAAAARKLQQENPDADISIVGLFCFEAFNYDRLKQEVQRLLGVDIDSAEKTQIHKGKFTATVEGKEHSCKVKELNSAVEKGCRFCSDFTAQFADVSVGSVGSQKGYSTVMARTDAGKRLLENLDLARAEADQEEITKISELKKERAEKNLASCGKQS